jgi:hypothetical protein
MRFEGDTKEDLLRVQSVFKEELLKLNPKLQLPI